MFCTTAMVATTEASPITEPTDRSMPPAMMTRVMPMLITPMMDAWRRIVRMLLTLVNVSGAVMAPTIDEQQQRHDEAEVAADGARHEPLEPGLLAAAVGARAARRAAAGMFWTPAVVCSLTRRFLS